MDTHKLLLRAAPRTPWRNSIQSASKRSVMPPAWLVAEGKSQVSIRVAVNSRRRGADGDQLERTDWFRARLGGGRGDYVARELRKGGRVLVRGRLEIGEWTTREGEVRTSHDIWADDVVNLSQRDGSPREESSRDEPQLASVGGASPRPAARAQAPAGGEDLDAELRAWRRRATQAL